MNEMPTATNWFQAIVAIAFIASQAWQFWLLHGIKHNTNGLVTSAVTEAGLSGRAAGEVVGTAKEQARTAAKLVLSDEVEAKKLVLADGVKAAMLILSDEVEAKKLVLADAVEAGKVALASQVASHLQQLKNEEYPHGGKEGPRPQAARRPDPKGDV